MIAESLVNHRLSPLRTTDTVEAAMEFMVQNGVSELPVIDKKQVVNYARLANLATLPKSKLLVDVIPPHPYPPIATIHNHLYELIPLLSANDLSVLAVCNNDGEFVGITEQKQINKYISESLTYRGLGAILVLNLDNRSYAPSHLARIIEENGAKIIGLVLKQREDQTLWVNIKLNTTIVKPIVTSLNRHDYRVENIFMSEDMDEENNREFDMVLRFFDI